MDDFLSTFIIPYFHTYVNGYHQIKEPKVKRIERGLRPARLYSLSNYFFFKYAFALSYAKKVKRNTMVMFESALRAESIIIYSPEVMHATMSIMAEAAKARTETTQKALNALL